MANTSTISQNSIKKLLKDNQNICPDSKEKLNYFCQHISEGYRQYKRHKDEGVTLKKLTDFTKEIIDIHNARIATSTNDLKTNYYKQPQYLSKIVEDYVASLLSKTDPSHLFTHVASVDDTRIDRFKEILNFYYGPIVKQPTEQLKQRYLKRLLLQMVSGIHLLSMERYSDAMIIWRSLIESICYYKILKVGDKKTENLFITRREDSAKIIGLVDASKAEMVNISSQIKNRKMGKSASWWEKQRFSWAKKIIAKGDPSAKLLMEKVNLGKYYPHYQVASLFTHEYLLDETHFKEISFMDYLIHLYWRALEEVREEFKLEFSFVDSQIKTIKKHEETIRKLLKKSREAFNRFSDMISD